MNIQEQLLQSKQSIHSTLKTLVQDRYVELEYQDHNHKSISDPVPFSSGSDIRL